MDMLKAGEDYTLSNLRRKYPSLKNTEYTISNDEKIQRMGKAE